MAHCTTCDYDFPVIVYFYFVIIVLVAFYVFALIKYMQLKKQLQYKSFIDKHINVAQEYGTKVTVIDASNENEKIDWGQALGIGFELHKRSKEKSQ